MYRDDNMPAGMVAPYQIQLDEDDSLIWAPRDCNSVIRMIVEDEDHDHVELDTAAAGTSAKPSVAAHDHDHMEIKSGDAADDKSRCEVN